MNLNDFIVNIFCEVDDIMKQNFPKITLRQRGPSPQLADRAYFSEPLKFLKTLYVLKLVHGVKR
ncbi:MAG TPA: hypothetical protein VMW72_18740 [Sedimentisphaerales bacterium]|nr:hypothetical protein [Sedimentisphaerales bacterium]